MPTKTKPATYRRTVRMYGDKAKMAECERKWGHIFRILPSREGEDKPRLICIQCDAEWRDEGY